jgi:hypothetical protein
VTTARELVEREIPCDCAGGYAERGLVSPYCQRHTAVSIVEDDLGIADVDIDTHRLVAVPKCETCGGDGATIPDGFSQGVGRASLCRACGGTGDAGVPVVLPAEIAEHLPALLDVALVHGWRMYGGKPWPKTTDDVLAAWLEANP